MIKVVKVLSVAMGVLIIGALGLLGYGLFYKTSPQNPQQENAASPPAVAVPAAATTAVDDFDAIGLAQPTGSVIAQVTAQGGVVYLTVQGGGVSDRVLVVDLVKRRVVGRIDMGDADSRPLRPAK